MGKKPGEAAEKAATQQKHICPECRTKMERRTCLSFKINHVTYGQNGMFWCCTSEKCDYRERS